MNEGLPLVSIIIPCKNEGINVVNTINSAIKAKCKYPFEIVIIDDGSIDGCCDFVNKDEKFSQIRVVKTEGIGLAKAKNLGAVHTKGEYFIFCDAHLFFPDCWIDALIDPIRSGIADAVNPGIADHLNPANIGYGYRGWNENLEPKWNTEVTKLTPSAQLAGGCFAISKDCFFDIGGFDRGFRVWGREDEEISIKMWLFGYKCYIQPNTTVLHVFRANHAPFKLTWDDINYNTLRMAYSHFNEDRIEKCRKLIQYSDLASLEAQVLQSGVLEQRKTYFSRRIHDDSWYMKQFKIPF